jgi:hypothetical protein
MSADLTRWNRAGLTRFRYLDANAVTFLELLRVELADRFPDWTGVAAPVVESETQRDERLQRQYEDPRGDWAWEITRALARSCHVLGEHVDAYANEGYLRTATQWEAVRKLVAVLDVQPAPPASASTPLVLEAKGAAGTLPAGFAVRHTPEDGSPPVVFETLEELAVDAALDALRPAGWNRSPAPLVDEPPSRPLPPIARRPARVIQGVGTAYQSVLDGHAPPGRGTFRVADLRTFDPTAVGGPALLPLWEARSKAVLLLGLPWHATELAPLAGRLLPELLAATPQELADATGLDVGVTARFLDELRTAQMSLVEDVFTTTRLEDLLSPGPAPTAPPPLWRAGQDAKISAGQVAIVLGVAERQDAAVVRVAAVDPASGAIALEPVAQQPAWQHWPRGEASLLARPRVVAVARVAGRPGALTFVSPHGLAHGDTVTWSAGGSWRFAAVAEADDDAVRLGGSQRPAAGTQVFRGVEVEGTDLPLGFLAAAVPATGGLHVLASSEVTDVRDDKAVLRHHRVVRANVDRVVFVPAGSRPAGRVASVAPAGGDGTFQFGGKPDQLAAGQWVVGEAGSRLLALRIERIEPADDHFTVAFATSLEPTPAVATLPVRDVMGVGPVTEERLASAGLRTVGGLAAASRTAAVTGLTATQLHELRAKAQIVLAFPMGPHDLQPLLDWSVMDALAATEARLSDELGKPVSWIREFHAALRLLQAVVDEPPLADLRIRDLLPIGSAGSPAGQQPDRIDRLRGAFEHTIRPAGWDRDDTPVTGARIALERTPPGLLTRGRRLVLAREGHAREATVVGLDAGPRLLDLAPPLSAEEGFTVGDLVVHANVVRAGHGEARSQEVLGSGDATQRSQRFVLERDDVAFVADPSMRSGVAAALTVTVAGQPWEQVATLRDSRPTDRHYEVRLTEDGELAVTFGDGVRGRRLPTGTNNVRVAYRVGAGLLGNLPAGSLGKPVRPSPRVATVRQPLDASGGNDREEVDALRSQAPRSVLTLDRAVSLTDLAARAGSQAGVWQARAFALPTGGGRHASVEVVVVPAGGGSLGTLAADLEAFLLDKALPGVDVRVTAFEPRPFDLEVELEVRTAQEDEGEIRKLVRAALLDRFALRRRALGASVFASELYAVVDGVRGVDSSRLRMGFGTVGEHRVLRATDRQVVHLDPVGSRLDLSVREYVL